ncbi:MAG: Uma2 family endonuclease [Acidobacteriota bacterium]|nr:Uma2 family endonuclease [Acidobacteriota bacterium]
MSQTLTVEPQPATALTLNIKSVGLTEEQFELLCRDNRDLRIELTAEGELIVMPPTGPMTGWRNSKIIQRLANWAEADGTGLCFDSSTLYTLPNKAKRSPDASWISRERFEALPRKERDKFSHICPDFVIELRSLTDRLATVKKKMQEYLDNGALLGWLIDPLERRVYVYRPGQPVECLDDPETVTGDPVLPGFLFRPREIWEL